MELYNQSKSYSYANINNLMANNLTISFCLKINSVPLQNYKLIENQKFDEALEYYKFNLKEILNNRL